MLNMCVRNQDDGYPCTPNNCPNVEDVHVALVVLHHHPDRLEKKGASAWLSSLQSSMHAWDLSVSMLRENRDIESSFFGAQTIRLKIQRSFHELEPEQLEEIRNKLLTYIKSVDSRSNDVVIRRLCLAMADLAFKLPSWTNPIEDIINEFSSYNVVPLMDILKAIPEEALNSPMDAGRHLELSEYLRRSATTIFLLLDRVLVQFKGNATIDVTALRCLTAWTQVHSVRDLVKTRTCDYAFQVMTSSIVPDATHEAASVFVSALMDVLKGSILLAEIGGTLIQKVKMFQEHYHLAVAHEDHHKVLRYSKIFTEVAECFLPEIIAACGSGQPHYSMGVFDLVLQCVGHHDYEVADRTFDLWYNLTEKINVEKVKNPRIVVAFQPYIERLIFALCNNSEMEPDQATLLDEGDEFYDFRARVFELVQEVVVIVGAKHTFLLFLDELIHNKSSWESYEAVLYMLCAIGSKVERFEDSEMHKIFDVILKFNNDNTHVAIRNTAVQLIGELPHVLTESNGYLEFALNHLITSLRDLTLAPQASISLGAICLWSPNNMSLRLSVLFPLTTYLDTYPITNKEAVQFLLAISSVVKVLKPPLLQTALRHFCWPHITKLSELVVGNMGITIGTRTDPVICCDRLSAVFESAQPSEYMDGKHPFLPLFSEVVMPVLLATCNKYKGDMRIMKRCCKALRFGIKAMGKEASELLQPVQETLLAVFADYQYKCLYKLAYVLIEQYIEHSACINELHNLLRQLTEPTLVQLPLGHYHFLDEVFDIIRNFMQHSPAFFLQKPFTEQIVQGALIALTLKPLDSAVKSMALKFFADLVGTAKTNQPAGDYFLRRQLVEQVIETYGKPLLMALWCKVVEDPLLIMEVSEFILQLRDFNAVLASRYLKRAVEALPTTFAAEARLAPSGAPLYILFFGILSAGSLEEINALLSRFAQAFAYWTRSETPINSIF